MREVREKDELCKYEEASSQFVEGEVAGRSHRCICKRVELPGRIVVDTRAYLGSCNEDVARKLYGNCGAYVARTSDVVFEIPG